MTHADYFEGVTSSNIFLFVLHAYFSQVTSCPSFILFSWRIVEQCCLECVSNQAKRNYDPERIADIFFADLFGRWVFALLQRMLVLWMIILPTINRTFSTMCLGASIWSRRDDCDKTPRTIHFSTFLKWKKILENVSSKIIPFSSITCSERTTKKCSRKLIPYLS